MEISETSKNKPLLTLDGFTYSTDRAMDRKYVHLGTAEEEQCIHICQWLACWCHQQRPTQSPCRCSGHRSVMNFDIHVTYVHVISMYIMYVFNLYCSALSATGKAFFMNFLYNYYLLLYYSMIYIPLLPAQALISDLLLVHHTGDHIPVQHQYETAEAVLCCVDHHIPAQPSMWWLAERWN